MSDSKKNSPKNFWYHSHIQIITVYSKSKKKIFFSVTIQTWADVSKRFLRSFFMQSAYAFRGSVVVLHKPYQTSPRYCFCCFEAKEKVVSFIWNSCPWWWKMWKILCTLASLCWSFIFLAYWQDISRQEYILLRDIIWGYIDFTYFAKLTFVAFS